MTEADPRKALRSFKKILGRYAALIAVIAFVLIVVIGEFVIWSQAASPPSLIEQAEITLRKPGPAVVLSLPLEPGETLVYSWLANGSVTFRIRPETGEVLIRVGQVGRGEFSVRDAGDHVFEFENHTGVPISVQWRIQRGPVLAFPPSVLHIGLAASAALIGVIIYLRALPLKNS